MKKNQKSNRNFWVAFACAILTLLWVISLLPFGAGTFNLGAPISIVAAILAVLNFIAWRRKKSVMTLVGDWIAKLRKSEDEEEKEEEPAAKPAQPAARPQKPAQNEAMTKAGLVWTWCKTNKSWVPDTDKSGQNPPAGMMLDKETNTFVKAPVKQQAAPEKRPAKPVLPKSMKDKGLVWTWNGTAWEPQEDHSGDPVPVGKFYDKETNTFIDLGEVFTAEQVIFIKQLIAAEVKKANTNTSGKK